MAEATLDKTRGEKTSHSDSLLCQMIFLGYGKTVSHVVIGLKTAKGTKQLKVN